MHKLIIFILIIFLLAGTAQAVEYGDGWKKVCQDGKCSYSNYNTIQRWDGKYIPYEDLSLWGGQWTYFISENITHYDLVRLGEILSLPKSYGNYTFGLTKVSLEFTVTPSQLNSKSTANGSGQWYITIPDKAVKTRFVWDNKKPIISNNTGDILDDSNYWYSVVNDERRLNYNQTTRNFGIASQTITFKFDSWTVGNGGSAWSGNSSFDNVTYVDGDYNNTVTIFPSNRTWNITYSAKVVPNQTGWDFWANVGNWTSTADNILYMNSSQSTSNNLAYRNTTVNLNKTNGYTITYRLLQNSTNANNVMKITQQDGTNSTLVSISPTTVSFTAGVSGGDTSYSMTTTNGFHTYTVIRYSGTNTISVYVDGVKRLNSSITGSSGGNNRIFFGDDTASPFVNTWIDYIYVDRISGNDYDVGSGNLTTWYNSGSGNETYQLDVNFSVIPTNTNYTTYYRQNATGNYVQIGTANAVANQSISLSTKYQNTDVIVQLFGNTTVTPELMSVTFWTQVVSGGGTPDYIPPAPINLVNTTGNFWVNNTWQAGAGNITNSYNISQNGTWTNSSTNPYYNATVGAHNWSNITVWAFNSSGNGTLNTTNVSQNTQIPNNIPILTNTTNQTVNENAIVFLDINCTDADSDVCTFSNNQTNNFTDWSTSTGTGNWTTNLSSSGIYYIDIGVTDGYGGQSNYTMTITINNLYYIPPVPTTNSVSTGNFYVNFTWTVGVGNVTDGYNVSVNGAWANTSNTYHNSTLSAHAWHNITIWAFNNTGNNLSLTSLTNNTQIPNNNLTQVSIGAKTVNEGDWLNFTVSSSDLDLDIMTYGTNATNGTFSTSNGNFNWSTNSSSSGIYYWYYNSSDGYGSTGNETVMITVNDVTIDNPPNITGWENNVTNNNSLSINLTTITNILFNSTSNQTITYWNFTGAGNIQGNNTVSGNATQTYNTNGTYYINLSAYNTNGTAYINWTVSVNLNYITTNPNITLWSNNKTNNQTLSISINTSEGINFNVTVNQTVDSYNWAINNSNQSNNFNSFNISWGTVGVRNVSVNATNINGTTQTIYWNVTVNDIVTNNPPNITGWSNTNTSNNTLTFTVQQNTNVTFNITINQTVTTTWGGTASPTKINGTNEDVSYAYKNFTTIGTFTVIPSCTNVNGTCTNIPTWTIIVNGTVTTYNISGYISNTLGAYLKDARVDFNNSFTLTDANGYYSFSSVNEGEYTTLARAIGYRNSTNSTEINSNTTINFTLNERKVSQVVSTPGFEIIISLITMITIYIMIRKRKNINNKKKI